MSLFRGMNSRVLLERRGRERWDLQDLDEGCEMEHKAKTTFIATGFVQVIRQFSTSNPPSCVPPYAAVASSPMPTAEVEVEVEAEILV